MLQFDTVMQKLNLQKSHQTMHMPTHGEYLVEVLCQLGFDSGFMWGYEDFFNNPQLLSQSPADILLVCGLDQHFTEDFLAYWPRVHAPHAYRILVSSEPIYSPLAYWVDDYNAAPFFHERFLDAFQPHAVLYPSYYDCGAARKKFRSSFEPLFYPLADPDLWTGSTLPWEQKRAELLFLGKTEASAWVQTRSSPWGWSRYQQLQYLNAHSPIPCAAFHESFRFRDCYQVANRYRFQLQLRSGYAFHTARVLQAAMVQSIPVLLLPHEAESLLTAEGPWLVPDQNVLVGWDGDYHTLWDKLNDIPLLTGIQTQLPELVTQIRARRTLQDLAQLIQHFFRLE